MAVLVVGIILVVVGGLGIGLWPGWENLWIVFSGSVPIMFVLFGLAAIAVGISSVKDKSASAQEDDK